SFIQVDEKGTEAAAATAVIVGARITAISMSPPPPPIVFTADHPFLFAIRERSTNTILFMGTVTDPGYDPNGNSPPPPPGSGGWFFVGSPPPQFGPFGPVDPVLPPPMNCSGPMGPNTSPTTNRPPSLHPVTISPTTPVLPKASHIKSRLTPTLHARSAP